MRRYLLEPTQPPHAHSRKLPAPEHKPFFFWSQLHESAHPKSTSKSSASLPERYIFDYLRILEHRGLQLMSSWTLLSIGHLPLIFLEASFLPDSVLDLLQSTGACDISSIRHSKSQILYFRLQNTVHVKIVSGIGRFGSH